MYVPVCMIIYIYIYIYIYILAGPFRQDHRRGEDPGPGQEGPGRRHRHTCHILPFQPIL